MLYFQFTALVIGTMFYAQITAGADTTGRCNTGPIQCCKQVYKARSPKGMQLLNESGINVHDVVGMVGAQCTPINVIGVGSGSHCTGQTVCCEKNNWNGVVAVGCMPVSVGA